MMKVFDDLIMPDVLMPALKKLPSEILISFLSSGAPLLYFYFNSNNIGELHSNLKSNITNDEMLVYIIFFFFLFILTAKIRDLYRNEIMKKIYNVVYNVSCGITNVYRVAAGVILALPLVWYISEPKTLTATIALYLLVLGLSFAGMSSLLSAIHERTQLIFQNQKFM